jgi:cytochrome c-type biogenesis protein CcmH
MLFWIVAGALGALVAGLLARPLLRPAQAGRSPATGGVPRPAGRARAATSSAASFRPRRPSGPGWRWRAACSRPTAPRPGRSARRRPGATLAAVAATAVVLVLGSLALYGALGAPGRPDAPRAARLLAAEAARAARPTQAEAEAAAPDASRAPSPDLAPLVEQLRAAVPTRPEDPEGWALLADIEARLGRFGAAARAQERVVALKGPAAAVEERVLLADFLVAAAGGVVTEAAEAALGSGGPRGRRAPGGALLPRPAGGPGGPPRPRLPALAQAVEDGARGPPSGPRAGPGPRRRRGPRAWTGRRRPRRTPRPRRRRR